MRKFSLFLLLATCAMPAMAQRDNDRERQSRRASPPEQSSSTPQRAARPQPAPRSEARETRRQSQRQGPVVRQDQRDYSRVERAQRYQQQQQVQQQQVQQRGAYSRSEQMQRYQQQMQQRQGQQQVENQGLRSERLERYRQRQLAGQQARGEALAPRQGRFRSIPTTRPQIEQAGPVRTDVQSGRRYDRDDRNRWSNHWRNDRRYDWRRHRDRNRFIFRIGFYSDPFGYSYRRFGIGSFLYSNYYQSNYWINDPWQYRLPPVYGPYRWVRYHTDALLIDTYSGEVVDVIHGFFW